VERVFLVFGVVLAETEAQSELFGEIPSVVGVGVAERGGAFGPSGGGG
jgi:hypothetical protein